METNPNIAKNYLPTSQAKAKSKILWKALTDKLNACGPPEEPMDGWKSVWKDFRYNLKRKMRGNLLHGTGGGPNKQNKYSENEKIVIAILDLNKAVSGNLSGKQFGDPSDANIQVAAGSSTSVNVTMEEADEQKVLLAMFNDDSLPQPDNNENTEPQPDNSEHFAEDVNPPPSRNKKAPMLIGVKLVAPLKNYHFSFLPGNFFCFLFSYLIIALHHDFRFFEFRFFCRSFRNS
ncbi:uncharacterized protein LOC129947318 [Eupeodes corollae]|uniref:uncharacterized protein LOC129947318 n=1 Tax=Eupeodes corollae TaxID=290404 RepID=UPI0024901610|nr:uncharacterized protein LOC129947318 [Eupeodes corollae]